MGKYILKDTDFGTYFTMEDASGKLLATSQIFSSHDLGVQAIEAMKASGEASVQNNTLQGNAGKPYPRFEMYADKTDEFRFRYRIAEGETLVTSVVFSSLDECYQTITCIKGEAATAPVEA